MIICWFIDIALRLLVTGRWLLASGFLLPAAGQQLMVSGVRKNQVSVFRCQVSDVAQKPGVPRRIRCQSPGSSVQRSEVQRLDTAETGQVRFEGQRRAARTLNI